MTAVLQQTTAVQSFSQATDADPWTFSVTVDQGANRALVAIVMLEGNGVTGDRSVTGMSYGGYNLYKVDAQTAPAWGACEVWLLPDAPVGTANLVVDLNGTDKGVCAVLVGQKIDGLVASPRIRPAAKTSGTGTSATVTVSGVTDDDLVFSALHLDGTGHAAAPGADQIEVVDRQSATSTNEGVVNTQPGTAGGVMSNTWTGSSPYALVAAAFQGAPPPVAKGYSQFNGAGSATVNQFRIPGINIANGNGFVAYALVRPTSEFVRSQSILEFRSESNLDRVLLEIDSGGFYAWSNQLTGNTLGDGYAQAVQDQWALVVWEKRPGGYSDVIVHMCDDPGGAGAWGHYLVGQDEDPEETVNGIVSISNYDFLALTGNIAMWGVWDHDWLDFSFNPNGDVENAFSALSTAGILGQSTPPFAHFDMIDRGGIPDLAGNGCWHDASGAPIVADVTTPWTFGVGGGGGIVDKAGGVIGQARAGGADKLLVAKAGGGQVVQARSGGPKLASLITAKTGGAAVAQARAGGPKSVLLPTSSKPAPAGFFDPDLRPEMWH